MFETDATAKHEAETQKTRAYDQWSSRPEIKMLISLLPPLETDTHRDCFAALLRSVFEAGHCAGSGSTAGEILKSMLLHRSEPRRS